MLAARRALCVDAAEINIIGVAAAAKSTTCIAYLVCGQLQQAMLAMGLLLLQMLLVRL